jgi:hypothetical protein
MAGHDLFHESDPKPGSAETYESKIKRRQFRRPEHNRPLRGKSRPR